MSTNRNQDRLNKWWRANISCIPNAEMLSHPRSSWSFASHNITMEFKGSYKWQGKFIKHKCMTWNAEGHEKDWTISIHAKKFIVIHFFLSWRNKTVGANKGQKNRFTTIFRTNLTKHNTTHLQMIDLDVLPNKLYGFRLLHLLFLSA